MTKTSIKAKAEARLDYDLFGGSVGMGSEVQQYIQSASLARHQYKEEKWTLRVDMALPAFVYTPEIKVSFDDGSTVSFMAGSVLQFTAPLRETRYVLHQE